MTGRRSQKGGNVTTEVNAALVAHGFDPAVPPGKAGHNAALKWDPPLWAPAAPAAGAAAAAPAALTADQTALIAAVTTFVSAGGQTDANADAVATALTAAPAPAAGAAEPEKVVSAKDIAANIAAWKNADAAGKAAALQLITDATAAFTALRGGRRRGRKSRKATKKAKKSKKATKKSKKSKKSKKAKKSRKTKGRK